ncbi:MAG TPA: transcription antitermination factor NusB [Gemmatimonadaceae bacterium]|nr:transcription antitermination factor NusB [Gemmatimonadaceae bacterium]
MPRTRVETRARARVLQALYAWDLRGEPALAPLATRIWDDLGVEPAERRLASTLITALAAEQRALDADLAAVTTNWRLERLSVIDRCVLRLAGTELRLGVTPPRVVIQEAVRLAERYGSARSAQFVNGVLDALARRTGLI